MEDLDRDQMREAEEPGGAQERAEQQTRPKRPQRRHRSASMR